MRQKYEFLHHQMLLFSHPLPSRVHLRNYNGFLSSLFIHRTRNNQFGGPSTAWRMTTARTVVLFPRRNNQFVASLFSLKTKRMRNIFSLITYTLHRNIFEIKMSTLRNEIAMIADVKKFSFSIRYFRIFAPKIPYSRCNIWRNLCAHFRLAYNNNNSNHFFFSLE